MSAQIQNLDVVVGLALGLVSSVRVGEFAMVVGQIDVLDDEYPRGYLALASFVGLLVQWLAEETGEDPDKVWQRFAVCVTESVEERGTI